jgi:hypothetical protein
MLLKLFQQSFFKQIAFVAALSILLWLPGILSPLHSFHWNPLSFSYYLFPDSSNASPLLLSLLGFLLALSESFILAYLLTKHELATKNNFFTSFLFILFISRAPEYLSLLPIHFALLFVLMGTSQLLDNFNRGENNNYLLTASIYFSIASLFIPSVLLLFPLVWISLLLFQQFNWRSIPISIIGLITPYFFIFLIYFWLDLMSAYILHIQAIWSDFISLPNLPKPKEIIELSVYGSLLLFASNLVLSKLGSQVISIRKKMNFMYWLLGLGIILSFFNRDIAFREFIVLPFTAILGFYFSLLKKTFWFDLFLSLLFLSILIQNYIPLFHA